MKYKMSFQFLIKKYLHSKSVNETEYQLYYLQIMTLKSKSNKIDFQIKCLLIH